MRDIVERFRKYLSEPGFFILIFYLTEERGG